MILFIPTDGRSKNIRVSRALHRQWQRVQCCILPSTRPLCSRTLSFRRPTYRRKRAGAPRSLNDVTVTQHLSQVVCVLAVIALLKNASGASLQCYVSVTENTENRCRCVNCRASLMQGRVALDEPGALSDRSFG